MDLKELALHEDTRRHPWELARAKVVASLLRDINTSQSLNVLDVGSGDIFLIQELQKEFQSASFHAVDTGYEPAWMQQQNEMLHASGQNIRVYNRLEDALQQVPRVDIVLLLDVLEHVPDDTALLQEILHTNKVDASTRFLITVPSFQWLFTAHDTFLGHHRRYTHRLLKMNTEAAGLTADRIGYFFFSLVWPRALAAQKEKYLGNGGPATGISSWRGGALVTGMLVAMLRFDYAVCALLLKVGIRLPGLSTYAICRKLAS